MSFVANNVAVKAFCGTVGTGKTQALVEHARALVEAGTDPHGMLVFSASQPAAQALRGRLAAALGEAAEGVRVATPLEYALEVLDCEEAFAMTGRRARVLSDFELDFFFEDMRVTGTDQRRLRGMLDFFFRGWTEMSDDDPSWLINEAEINTQAFARRRLAMVEAYHPCEVSAAAVRLLAAHPEMLSRFGASCVLADDFRAMSRASQRLCTMLAREGIAVCWDEVGTLKGEERYGYAEGLSELSDQADVDRVELRGFRRGHAAHAALGNLFKQESLMGFELPAYAGACEGEVEVFQAPTLEREAGLVAKVVADALQGGMSPEDVYVCVPKDRWGRGVEAALACAGVPVSFVASGQPLAGDVRDLSQCEAAVVYNALRLVADPDDALAWRCWCGFGDYLTRSSGFSALCDEMARTGERLPQLLEALAAGRLEGGPAAMSLDRAYMVQGWHAAVQMVSSVAGLRGMALLEQVSRLSCGADAVPAELLSLLGQIGPDEDAAALAARVRARLFDRAFGVGSVCVGGTDGLLGLSSKLLVLCGLVNGLFPSRRYFDLSEATVDEQAKMHVRLVGELAQVCGRAGERLVLTGFERADIVDSERLKLASLHVRLRGGKRVCDFAPSVAIAYITGEKTCYTR